MPLDVSTDRSSPQEVYVRSPHPNHRPQATLPPELRRTRVPPLARLWIERTTGVRVIAVNRLAGASTSAVHRINLANGGRLVLRRYVWRWVVDDDPLVVQREADGLAFARAAGLPVPELVAADTTGADVGDGTPAVLMTYLTGRAVGVPDLVRLATAAAAIHDVDASSLSHAWSPWWDASTFRPPAAARQPHLWEHAAELGRTAMPAHRPTLIHRDLHPGNVLWTRGRCTGVVDWVNACRGPIGCDIAHCRGNLIDLGGDASADGFEAAYESITGVTHHPYWEIVSVLEHGPSHWTAQEVIPAEARLERALALL